MLPSWSLLGLPWEGLGPPLGTSWAVFGLSWALLGRSWGALGRSLGALGRLFGASCRSRAVSSRSLALLGRSGDALGCPWVALRSLLGTQMTEIPCLWWPKGASRSAGRSARKSGLRCTRTSASIGLQVLSSPLSAAAVRSTLHSVHSICKGLKKRLYYTSHFNHCWKQP